MNFVQVFTGFFLFFFENPLRREYIAETTLNTSVH